MRNPIRDRAKFKVFRVKLNTWDFPPWLKTVGGYKLTMIHWLVQLLGTQKHQHPPF